MADSRNIDFITMPAVVITKTLKLDTKGSLDIINITPKLTQALEELTQISSGILTVFIPGATGAITAMEYEPGLIADLKALIEHLVPQNQNYMHNRSHLDGNAHSHLRASLLGPSVCIPFVDRRLILGTWQQIVFIEFDNRPRQRQIVLQIIGT